MNQLGSIVLSALRFACGLQLGWSPSIRAPRVSKHSIETGLHAPHRLRHSVAGDKRAAARQRRLRVERARQKARARR